MASSLLSPPPIKMSEYPECEKLLAVSKESNSIGQFLDWLTGEKGFELGKYPEDTDHLVPAVYNIEKLLAEYFDIDLDKVEEERLSILASLQK